MLTAEVAILARLRATIPGMKMIASSAAIAGTIDMAALCPSIIVHPGDGKPIANHDGTRYKEEQEWRVIVIQKLVANDEKRDTTYQPAGAVMSQIVQSLSGLVIDEKVFRPLSYAGRPEPAVNPGYAEFQLNFTTNYSFGTA